MEAAAPTILFLILIAAMVLSKPTAYEALQGFNFPMGILPKGAVGYDLEEEKGKFNVNLQGPCSFSIVGSYELSYEERISGYISNNKLTNLSGITVKVFFFWLSIVEVRRSGDVLQFSIGIASANFPIYSFKESPECGCGFDCDGIRIGKTKMKDDVDVVFVSLI